MFRFRELSLWNWDYWSAVRIPLDRKNVIIVRKLHARLK